MSDSLIEAALRSEVNADVWELPSGRAAWLLEHLRETKLEIWSLIAAVPLPQWPDWEVQRVQSLSAEERRSVVHAGRTFAVPGLLRQRTRHTVWQAGQLAALRASADA